jgi:hypothetical protein
MQIPDKKKEALRYGNCGPIYVAQTLFPLAPTVCAHYNYDSMIFVDTLIQNRL